MCTSKLIRPSAKSTILIFTPLCMYIRSGQVGPRATTSESIKRKTADQPIAPGYYLDFLTCIRHNFITLFIAGSKLFHGDCVSEHMVTIIWRKSKCRSKQYICMKALCASVPAIAESGSRYCSKVKYEKGGESKKVVCNEKVIMYDRDIIRGCFTIHMCRIILGWQIVVTAFPGLRYQTGYDPSVL